jgi:hypothetical protein
MKHVEMDGFDGFEGIQFGSGQLVSDIIFSLLFALLFVFSLVFHANYHLFMKMVRDVFQIKNRLSLFEDIGGNETAFRSFMIFQSLGLSSLAIFIFSRHYGYISDYSEVGMNLFCIGLLFIALFLFYLFKQFLYSVTGFIFALPEQYRTWRIGYTASTGFWGVLLYIPLVWMAFIGTHLHIPVLMFVFLYLLWRIVIIYKTICIFNIKGISFVYIILYLCAQEFLPLIFLYEGLIYLYNLY